MGECMTGQEIVRLIEELRAKGMSDTEIVNLILTVEGKEEYKTKKE